ncbi:HalOD1 output domain-containing protein [Halomarina ordinaria]|uniref:HalOD1 output domain-containing protein n=1 Tax=Halomarina ordinaria TaxID=3033939 RepID=A0ABD5UBC3_9EURY|nr:HalOD1 output domain-containing protein [Halomarina sp. PSRA2]
MSPGGNRWDGEGRPDRTVLNRAQFTDTDAESLLATVTIALGEVLDEDPMLLEPPLASVAEWDALERLFTEQRPGESVIEYVAFTYRDVEVVIRGSGEVLVCEPR